MRGASSASGSTAANDVHLDGAQGLDCLLAFGERWRGETTAGLRALGLDPDCLLP